MSTNLGFPTTLLLLACTVSSVAAEPPTTAKPATAHVPVTAEPAKSLPHSPALSRGPHKGTLKVVGKFQAETVVAAGGIKVFLYGLDGKAVSLRGARGVASLLVEGNAKRYRYDLFPAEDNSLKVDVDFSKIAGRQISVDYQIVDASSSTIRYQDLVVVPADQAQVDAIAIARQKVCPVSGKLLGSMGSPIAVDANGHRVFVCCAGCVSVVKNAPAKYSSTRIKVEIVASKATDSALIAKQAKCPVMDEPLGSMGQPIKLLVGGKPLFLCCKGCIKKVQADPGKYLAMVSPVQVGKGEMTMVLGGNEQVRPGVFQVSKVDQPFIAAQKRCPVMDEPLDAMGGPYRVSANGKTIYICCPGCAKKIAAEPDKYLAVLKSQGVEAPLSR